MTEFAPFFLSDPDATADLAQRLAPRLAGGDVLLLRGEIGAGKSHFARALIQSFVDEDVPSPTFTIVQTYEAPEFEIWHTDLYRLSSADEAAELGLFDAFETALCLVEWPEKLGQDAPKKALTLQLLTQSQGRRLLVSGDPQIWAGRLRGIFE